MLALMVMKVFLLLCRTGDSAVGDILVVPEFVDYLSSQDDSFTSLYLRCVSTLIGSID
jgi:hypothetical protein